MTFPHLTSEHLSNNARVYANRFDLARGIKPIFNRVDLAKTTLPATQFGHPNIVMERSELRICEVGVALGEFSAFMLETFNPIEFVAVDLFQLHKLTHVMGQPVDFKDQTHLEYYKHKFPQVTTLEGMSTKCLQTLPDKHFDLIYVDAAHDYENVKADAQQAARCIKDNGVIVFNDYIMFDHVQGAPYGVVQAVNELVTSGGWKVIAFALQQQMFCDIAIQRV